MIMIRNDVFTHHNDDEMVGPRILYVHLSPAQPVLAESLLYVLSPDRCRNRRLSRNLTHRPSQAEGQSWDAWGEVFGQGPHHT